MPKMSQPEDHTYPEIDASCSDGTRRADVGLYRPFSLIDLSGVGIPRLEPVVNFPAGYPCM